MKPIGLMLLLAWLCNGALAADSEAPLRHHHDGVTTILSFHAANSVLARGDNDIGNPKHFVCEGLHGCVVVMIATTRVWVNEFNTTTCSYVDGIPGIPGCSIDPNLQSANTVRQQIKVAQGPHIIQTKVTTNEDTDRLRGWAFEYKIYERKNYDAD